MAVFPVDEFFVPEFTSPATFTASGGAATDIDVLFERDSVVHPVGGAEFVNASPRATCRTRDVAGAKTDDTLQIHGFLAVTDDNTILVDGQGNALMVPRVHEYLVHSAHPDESGLTELILTTDT
jgi:hypothetical protein